MAKSGLLTIIVEVVQETAEYEAEYNIDKILGGFPAESSGTRLSDKEWARDHIDSGRGVLDVFFGGEIEPELARSPYILIAGHIDGVWTNSIDYGRDYDETFDVVSVKGITEEERDEIVRTARCPACSFSEDIDFSLPKFHCALCHEDHYHADNCPRSGAV